MTLGLIQARAASFDTRTRKQNWATAVAVGIVVIGNILQISGGVSLLTRLGVGLIILATAFVVYRHGRMQGAGGPAAGDLGLQQSLAIYRAQLVRHHEAVRRYWRDYALPFVPGIALSIAGRHVERARSLGDYALLALVFAVVIAGISWVNAAEAGKLQREIDELDRLSGRAR